MGTIAIRDEVHDLLNDYCDRTSKDRKHVASKAVEEKLEEVSK